MAAPDHLHLVQEGAALSAETLFDLLMDLFTGFFLAKTGDLSTAMRTLEKIYRLGWSRDKCFFRRWTSLCFFLVVFLPPAGALNRHYQYKKNSFFVLASYFFLWILETGGSFFLLLGSFPDELRGRPVSGHNPE